MQLQNMVLPYTYPTSAHHIPTRTRSSFFVTAGRGTSNSDLHIQTCTCSCTLIRILQQLSALPDMLNPVCGRICTGLRSQAGCGYKKTEPQTCSTQPLAALS